MRGALDARCGVKFWRGTGVACGVTALGKLVAFGSSLGKVAAFGRTLGGAVTGATGAVAGRATGAGAVRTTGAAAGRLAMRGVTRGMKIGSIGRKRGRTFRRLAAIA